MSRRLMLFAAALALSTAGCAAMPAEMTSASAPASTPSLRDAPPIESIRAMSIAVDRAIDMAGRLGADRVLVVLDLDSTLLRDVGRSPDLDAMAQSDPIRFRQVERTVMYLKSLVPTETGLADQLARLDTAGISTILLTARGQDMRDMTLREMAANGITLPHPPECGPPLCIGRGTIGAEQVLAAARETVGAQELARVGFERGRAITMWDGILMAAGQDKGILMRTVGRSMGDYRGYVFVDDAERNVVNVARAAQAMTEEVAVFHYASPEPGSTRSKAEANAAWQAAERAICAAFNPRWCR